MYEEKTISENLVYSGRVIKVFELEIKNHKDESAKREVARHSGGACIIPVDDEGNVYTVMQYRKPIEQNTIEIPAGKLEPGEDPLECAIRELKEEAGLEAAEIISLGFIFPTPGYCDEILYIYMARNLKIGDSSPDPGEYLTCNKINISECIKMVENGKINDGKTVVAILRAARLLGK